MQVSTKAIVLSSLKYGDTSLVVKAYTLSHGLKSYLLKGILKARKGNLKAAYFQPLNQLEIVASHRNKGSLEHIKEVRTYYPYTTLPIEIHKGSIALFLAEMLSNSIMEQENNNRLYAFLEYSLQWLDSHTRVENFHIIFLMQLSRFLGFFPDVSHPEGYYLDLQAGTLTKTIPSKYYLEGDLLALFIRLLGMDFDTVSEIKLNKNNRQELLKSLVLFYELHLQGFRKPKSLAVLNEVFS